ncbi:hypothetical protein C1I60_14025 [Paenibacillus terrae]|uniref:Uncharacterized protein n=1 Tax=Paenibacillus terrae TaxID=159743 RepID=A0A4V5SU76_9BACL|nr:hypothetical protein C1I60_14025 [Paenibacillus terrae]
MQLSHFITQWIYRLLVDVIIFQRRVPIKLLVVYRTTHCAKHLQTTLDCISLPTTFTYVYAANPADYARKDTLYILSFLLLFPILPTHRAIVGARAAHKERSAVFALSFL